MKRDALKTAILLMMATVMVMMSGCSKKSIDSTSLNGNGTQLTQEELAAQEAARRAEQLAKERQQQGIEEQRLQDEAMRKRQTEKEKAAKARFENQDIHFSYDSSELTPEARMLLKEKAEWLTRHTYAAITIEGHCDERGTTEYNLALGEKRALTAKQYLIDLGVSANRMRTISYGEEKPLVEGGNEAVWAKNRRAHFEIR